jgi:hydroxypyruvate reductase
VEQGASGAAEIMNIGPLVDIFNAALSAADPYRAVAGSLRIENGRIYAGGSICGPDRFDRVIVVGAGKATAPMAAAVEDVLGSAIEKGLIVVKYRHARKLRTIEQVEAAHPIPDEAGVEGTERILDLVRSAGENTLVICLLSGGGSALLVAPARHHAGGQAEDDRTAPQAGASINELNAVRKHLSAVKGGRLARAAYPAQVLTLILSDVIGNRLDVIASGPTVPDKTTFADAANVIERYGLKRDLPPGVVAFIERGLAGQEPETAKKGEACFKRTAQVIVGGLVQALSAAKKKADDTGWTTEVVTAELQGEARDAAVILARTALHVRDRLKPGERRCLLFGGETTVTVRGNGKGGRNQELALAFASEIIGQAGITLLSAGTDGTDGPTDAAGAVVDGSTISKGRELGIHPEAYLKNNDSYSFFAELDALADEKHHFITGPTGTNVMDLQVVLVEGQDG